MYAKRAFQAGVVAAAVMSILLALARAMGMPAKLALMLGSMVTQQTGAWTWILGFAIHLLAGGIFGLIYGALFQYAFRRAGWLVGVLVGAVHTVGSGFLLAAMPLMHPLIPELMPAPGAFMSALGAPGIIAFTALHLIFGVIVGSAYPMKRPEKPVSEPREPKEELRELPAE